jgi:hypothetical protein
VSDTGSPEPLVNFVIKLQKKSQPFMFEIRLL